jgi:hypothetical protein
MVVGTAQVAKLGCGAFLELVHRNLHESILAWKCFFAACDNFPHVASK